MPLPVVAMSFVGGIVAAIVQVLSSRIGQALVGLGLTFVGVKGFEAFIGYAVSEMQGVIANINSGSGPAGSLTYRVIQLAAYAGLFDALNVLISGFMAMAALAQVRFFLGRLK